MLQVKRAPGAVGRGEHRPDGQAEPAAVGRGESPDGAGDAPRPERQHRQHGHQRRASGGRDSGTRAPGRGGQSSVFHFVDRGQQRVYHMIHTTLLCLLYLSKLARLSSLAKQSWLLLFLMIIKTETGLHAVDLEEVVRSREVRGSVFNCKEKLARWVAPVKLPWVVYFAGTVFFVTIVTSICEKVAYETAASFCSWLLLRNMDSVYETAVGSFYWDHSLYETTAGSFYWDRGSWTGCCTS